MKTTHWVVLGAAVLMFVGSGCKGGKGGKGKAQDEQAAAAKGSAAAKERKKKNVLATAGTKKNQVKATRVDSKAAGSASPGTVLDAQAFFKDCQALGAIKAMAKYSKGVTVSGSLLRASVGVMGDHQLSLTVSGTWPSGKWLTISFSDKGKGAKAKAPKKGEKVKVMCKTLSTISPKGITLKDCKLSQ